MKSQSQTVKALIIIKNNLIQTPKRFAEIMWPDSEGWNKCSNIGRGATRGVGMWLAAGSFLSKLAKQGLITKWYRGDSGQDIFITKKGEDFITREALQER